MAVTVTTVRSGVGKSVCIADVEATADADTTATIAHGMGAVPLEVVLLPRANTAAISLWRVTTLDATNVVLTKSTTAGSGGAGVQLRVIARLDNHLIH